MLKMDNDQRSEWRKAFVSDWDNSLVVLSVAYKEMLYNKWFKKATDETMITMSVGSNQMN